MAGREIIRKIQGLLSQEIGTVHKEPGGRISVCLVYPNTYHVGMSSLGFQGVYTLLNERSDVVCERAFLPEEKDMEEYRRTGTEILSLESQRPLHRFDILAFSVSFENDYPHILRILDMSRVPLRSSSRGAMHPLLIMGGACAFFNPEPVADFFDIVFIGEAEEMLPEFIAMYGASRDRKDLFDRARQIEGLYLPHLYDIAYGADGRVLKRHPRNGAPPTIKRRFVQEISTNALRQSIITPDTEFSRMWLTEVMRGCPWSCRFCVAGFVYRPVRKKGLPTLEKEMKEVPPEASRVGLIAPSLSDYPDIKSALCIEGVDFSITSLRASRKSAELVGYLKRHKSVSIAPETGTERLRQVIDKRVTREDIIETSRLILREGVETLRLYFMVGLPTEGEEDIEAIVSLVEEIRSSAPQGGITLTVSTFVPKPFTPFQWHPMTPLDTVKARLRTIKKGLATVKGVKVFHDVPKYAYMQGFFSLGDRRVSSVLEEMLRTEDWRRASSVAGLDPAFFIFREKEYGDVLPWDFIDNGISKEHLWSSYQEAMAASA